jgi:alkylhydroperoxidase family enzyme
MELDYSKAGVVIRDDLRAAHERMLDYIVRPGSCFTGAERVAIAGEGRLAETCTLCQSRKEALSPEHVAGEHATTGALPAAVVDLIHRVRSDPGRVSRRVFEAAMERGMSEGEYVEAVGITAFTAGLDYQCRGLGIPYFELPDPVDGEPSGHLSANTTDGIAFVPLLLPEQAAGDDADIYGESEFVPNIVRALSLVPDHVRQLRAWSNVHYVDLGDMSARRAIDRAQIELVAARVSALNQCFY